MVNLLTSPVPSGKIGAVFKSKMDTESLIIIVTYNSQDFVETCLSSVAGQTYKNWFLVIIDNNSEDGTVAKIRDFKNKHKGLTRGNLRLIILDKNIGFSRAVNYAVFNFILKKRIPGKEPEYLILLNPDMHLKYDALHELVSTFDIRGKHSLQVKKIGAAGGIILDYKKDIIQHLGGKTGDNFITSHIGCGKNYSSLKKEYGTKKGGKNKLDLPGYLKGADYVTGAFFATEFKLFKAAGGFDPGYRPAYFEELDYCIRIRRTGRRVAVNYNSVARHFEGASVKKFSRNFYRYYHKNRIRCMVINIGFFRFFKTFLPSELSWLKNKATKDQTGAIFYAYFINLVFLPYNLAIKLKNHLILNKLELK